MKLLNLILVLFLVGTFTSCGSDNKDDGGASTAPPPVVKKPVVSNTVTASCSKLSSLLTSGSFANAISANDPWGGGTGYVDITTIGYTPIGYYVGESTSYFTFSFTSFWDNSCDSEFIKRYNSSTSITVSVEDSDDQIYGDKIASFGTTEATILASLRSYLTSTAKCTEYSSKVFEVCKDSIECIVVNFNYPLFANPTRYTHKRTTTNNYFGDSYYSYDVNYSGFETSCWSSF